MILQIDYFKIKNNFLKNKMINGYFYVISQLIIGLSKNL